MEILLDNYMTIQILTNAHTQLDHINFIKLFEVVSGRPIPTA